MMPQPQTVEAIYENGILRPLKALEGFPERCKVKITTAIPGGRKNPVTTPTSQVAFRKHACDHTSLTGTI